MITLVYSYYDNGGMLDRHFQEWENYAPDVKAEMRAIIIDDGSPNDAAINHMRDPGFPVELYRIKQNIPWNVAGARNLGMKFAKQCNANGHNWNVLTDIDHLLGADQAGALDFKLVYPPSDCAFLLKRQWADGRPLNPHPNSYLMCNCLYWKTGGCDEDWAGYWGAGEQAFRKALTSVARGVGVAPYDDIYLTHFGREDIPDASTREWGRRDSKWDWKNNPKLVEKVKLGTRPENPLRFDWERLV